MDIKEIKEVLKFYADTKNYFEQPTLSGYKAPPVMKDEGRLAQSLLKRFEIDDSDCADSKGAYP